VNWRAIISGILENKKGDPRFRSKPTFYPPGSMEEIKELESALNARLSSSLQSLLQETNGVMEMLSIDGGEWLNDLWLIWPIDEITNENLFFRGEKKKGVYEREFDQLLFFTGAGCDGILFAHPINQNRHADSQVVVWHPIEDELTEVAPDLQTFLGDWCTGRLAV
jgi:hypothetical protein